MSQRGPRKHSLCSSIQNFCSCSLNENSAFFMPITFLFLLPCYLIWTLLSTVPLPVPIENVLKHLALCTLTLLVVSLQSMSHSNCRPPTVNVFCAAIVNSFQRSQIYIRVCACVCMCVDTPKHAITNVHNSLGRIVTFKSLAIKFVLSDFMGINVNIV